MDFLLGPPLSHGVHTILSTLTGESFVAKLTTGGPEQHLHASIQPHPHILSYLGTVSIGGLTYMRTELVEMRSLSHCVAAFGPLPPPLVASFATQVALGLAHLHAAGHVHADIKASNLLLSKEGVCKIADFGRGDGEGGEYSLASAAWLAPELSRGGPPSPAGDVWALGIALLELLTGAAPHAALPAAAAVYAIAREGPALPQGLPPAAAEFLRACLARDAGARSSAAQLLALPWAREACGRLVREGAPHSARLAAGVARAAEGPACSARSARRSRDGSSGSSSSEGGGGCSSGSDSDRECGAGGGGGRVPRARVPLLPLPAQPPPPTHEWRCEWAPLACPSQH